MKKLIYITFMVAAALLNSCSDFLQREPIDFGDETSYFKSVNDLKIYTNTYYDLLPKMESGRWGGLYVTDNNSDNQAGANANQLFYKGDKQTPLVENSEWQFDKIRDLNYFLDIVPRRLTEGSLNGDMGMINHFLGEAYFFKAYDYFRLLSTIGDAPILDKVPSDNYQELVDLSKRAPRNEVARYILSMLDKAYEMMLDKPFETGRLTKDAAMLLKARVALYEATWEKYHQGTAFVPGTSQWPGAASHPDFKFAGGSIESEYNFFFDQAIQAADAVASKRRLYAGEYIKLFNDTKGTIVNSADEIILARYYLRGVNGHAVSNFLERTGGGTGFTRAMVQTFLTKSGLPIYADPTYAGDVIMYDEMKNRDVRLTSSVKVAGFVKEGNDTIVNYLPFVYIKGNQGSTTGYDMKKWISKDQDEALNVSSGTSITPVFRSAEANLIYMEAYYERHGALDGKATSYWKELRHRAGVSDDIAATIAATDLSQENDLAVKSKNTDVDKTLYNIRRERRCEFIAEGMRLDDLKRWCSLDQMQGYQTEGFNLWADVYKYYKAENLTEGGTVSAKSLGDYLRPYQISNTSIAYNGYFFPQAHYLEPIPVTEIRMSETNGQAPTIYQNPGWPSRIAGTADYSFTGN